MTTPSLLRCLIVDDEPLARNLLEDYVRKVPFLALQGACASPLAALDVLRRQPVELLLLDVHMPDIMGTTLLRILPQKPLVILTTAYSEYALESYELDVVDYLLKPITLERFLRAVHKAAQRLQAPAPPSVPPAAPAADAPAPFVFVKDGAKLIKVQWADILYVEGLKDYVTIHTRQQKIVSLQRLKSLEAQLPAQQFIRIHHSYIVALAGIEVVHKDRVQIGGRLLPISDTYRRAFQEFVRRNHLQPE
ncbi:LytR/AlgR family response regulator transcription factor [Hymenobacter weizhouensis]|uniref:LytR/AlgR family response regulator transcription factor n=1 Tax=Hymenobacter sp. YIM 151500-1 TaxID=2987689 RepID=UPI002225E038|nr:LytTR family DNA-binding domain-containing protein [Hymenobacter sp. YIM 151500-1]UYZ64026.1 LytTR family DNA-binding domain-containing protein [Hymenobacter sp. YIM 151500-1]